MRRSLIVLLASSLVVGISACNPGGATPATAEPTATVLIDATATIASTAVSSGAAPTLSDGATTTDSGLMYEDLTVGDGAEAMTGSRVTVHYTGYLQDGTVFDSSLDRGDPFTFALGTGNVIPGWDEGVTGMKVGGQRRLVIPADLAYGESGAGGVIPPNATLTFDVELLEVAEPLTIPEAPEQVASYETTDSGLEYAILEEGDGDVAAAGDFVSVHYAGFLTDGTRFDSSYQRGEPIQFILGQGNVIPGWDEGIAGMKVGERRQLRIPPDLAYGAAGVTGAIPGNATLIFDVQLVAVETP